jgi:hypothetical protein
MLQNKIYYSLDKRNVTLSCKEMQMLRHLKHQKCKTIDVQMYRCVEGQIVSCIQGVPGTGTLLALVPEKWINNFQNSELFYKTY